MKTFDNIKNELLKEYNHIIENLKKPSTMTPDYLNNWKNEMTEKINNIDEATKEEIQRKTQHIIDMINNNKSLEDIIKFNSLGVNAYDIDLISVIEKCMQYKNNSVFEKELKDTINNKLGIEQVKENEINKMGM